MNSNVFLSAPFIAAVALGAVITVVFITMRVLSGTRKLQDRELRKRDLKELATNRSLTQLERIPNQLKLCAAALGGRGRDAGLSEVLQGHDNEGTYYLARRVVGGQEQQAVLFEHKLLTLPGLRIGPARLRPPGFFERVWNRIRGAKAQHGNVRLEWEVDPTFVDDRTGLMAHALLSQMAEIWRRVQSQKLFLEVNNQRVAIYSPRLLEDDALRVFLDAALELRFRAMNAPRASGALKISPGDSRRFRPLVEEEYQRVPYGPLSTENLLAKERGAGAPDGDSRKVRPITREEPKVIVIR